jgi:predicted O-methyltransferase YrrM
MLDSDQTAGSTMTWRSVYQEQFAPLLAERIPADKHAAKRGLRPGLGQRIDGFRLMFDLLLKNPRSEYHIIETGTCRDPGNWKDGQSAVLFSSFVDIAGGWVRSVDINPDACERARQHISCDRFSVFCSDSVAWLQQQPDLDQIDLFYLDSYDVKWQDDTPSAEHHLREFQTIEPFLRPGTVVAIDDNARFANDGRRTGKGRCIVEYLESKNILPVYDHYQIIYQF